MLTHTILFCRFHHLRLYTYIHTKMFLSVSNLKSTSIESLSINPGSSQAVVRYIGNEQPYLYGNVDFAPMYNMLYKEVESVGRWVNTNLKQDPRVTCYSV